MQTVIKAEPSLSLLASPLSIVVATDLTDIKQLLPHAIAQAKRPGARVTLVHALATPQALLPSEAEQEQAKQRVRTILEKAAHHAQTQGIRCSAVLRDGDPLDAVLEEIEARQATRLIIGTHGHGYAGQEILGHVANALLRTVDLPVFAIGPHVSGYAQHTTPRRILHPVSLAGDYRKTAAFALHLAQAYDAELTLLHVMDSALLKGTYVKEIFATKDRQLKELISTQPSSSRVNTIVACGDTVLEVLKLSSATDTDWILIGLEHDLPWWSMSNNVAYQAIAQTEWPVITFRPHAATYKPFHSLEHSKVSSSASPVAGHK